MTKEDPYITWRELKELVEKEALGRDVDGFVVRMPECLDGTSPTSVEITSGGDRGPCIILGTW